MHTESVPCTELEVGDEYVVRCNRLGRTSLETRTVLEVLETGRFIGQPFALLAVRADDGNTHRANINGVVDRVVTPWEAPMMSTYEVQA